MPGGGTRGKKMPDARSEDDDAALPRRPIVKGAGWDLAVIRWVTADLPALASEVPASDEVPSPDPDGALRRGDLREEKDP
jgi:hypothetical protein